jgi:hypothetical protein
MSNNSFNNNNGESSNRPWAKLYKQTNANLEDIHEGLLKHIENVENENVKFVFNSLD